MQRLISGAIYNSGPDHLPTDTVCKTKRAFSAPDAISPLNRPADCDNADSRSRPNPLSFNKLCIHRIYIAHIMVYSFLIKHEGSAYP